MGAVHTGLYVIMGVSGSGKSLIGAMFARALDVEFVEGDDLHPPDNVSRMAAGIPLTDENRRGWLTKIADRLRDAKRARLGLVVSCSALKRIYRDLLRSVAAADVRFVYLAGSRELLAARMANRRGHFMPPALLESQLEQRWRHEMPAAVGHALRQELSAPCEIHKAHVRCRNGAQ